MVHFDTLFPPLPEGEKPKGKPIGKEEKLFQSVKKKEESLLSPGVKKEGKKSPSKTPPKGTEKTEEQLKRLARESRIISPDHIPEQNSNSSPPSSPIVRQREKTPPSPLPLQPLRKETQQKTSPPPIQSQTKIAPSIEFPGGQSAFQMLVNQLYSMMREEQKERYGIQPLTMKSSQALFQNPVLLKDFLQEMRDEINFVTFTKTATFIVDSTPISPPKIADCHEMHAWIERNAPRFTEISCNGADLSSVPKEIFSMRNLKKLDLGNNKIQTVPQELGDLPHLVSLCLNNNKITALPEKFLCPAFCRHKSYEEIEKILFSAGNESGFTTEVSQIRSLDLSGNLLQSIPPLWIFCQRLSTLHLQGNLLQDLPLQGAHSIKSLSLLDLSRNKFADVPQIISEWNEIVLEEKASLKALPGMEMNLRSPIADFSDNAILRARPQGFEAISVIVHNNPCEHVLKKSMDTQGMSPSDHKFLLFLQKASFTVFHPEAKTYENESFPPTIVTVQEAKEWLKEKAKMVTEIECSNADLEELPSQLHIFSNLTKLDLHGNAIHELPKDMKPLKKVRTLNLSNNLLHTIPESFFEALPNLRSCDLSHNYVENLPESLGKENKLTRLTLSRNGSLSTLPSSLSNHPSLISLFLDGTSIERLKVSDFLQLKELSLLEVPLANYDDLLSLQNLRHLYLGDATRKVPKGLLSLLKNLHNLSLLTVSNTWGDEMKNVDLPSGCNFVILPP